jgi:hypothetical protein
LEEVVPKVDNGIIGESQDETGRSGDKDTDTGSSGQQLRNLRNSRMVSFRETQKAKAYVPLQISLFFIFMSCSNQAPTSVYVLPQLPLLCFFPVGGRLFEPLVIVCRLKLYHGHISFSSYSKPSVFIVIS